MQSEVSSSLCLVPNRQRIGRGGALSVVGMRVTMKRTIRSMADVERRPGAEGDVVRSKVRLPMDRVLMKLHLLMRRAMRDTFMS